MKRPTLVYGLISFAFFIGWGCSLVSVVPSKDTSPNTGPTAVSDLPQDGEGTAPPDPGGAASTTTGPESDDAAASIVAPASAPAAPELPTFGPIAFEVDSSTTASIEFSPGENDTILQLTDGAGLTWTLTVPGIAMDKDQTLTMTALAGLESSGIPGDLAGGVLLEPDGLEFLVPATLTVTGESLKGTVFLLTGEHDGSAVELALMNDASGSAQISHFSSGFASGTDDDKTLDDWYKKLDADERAIIDQVKSLLRQKDIQVPEPPSIPVECTDEKEQAQNEKMIEDFLIAARNPESPLIASLMAIKKGKALLGRDFDDLYTYEKQLLWRLVKKARLLISTYHGQAEKLLPVTRFALQVSREVSLMGLDDPGEKALFLEEIAAWCDQVVDQLIEDVITKHDYKKANAAWMVARWAALLGSDSHTVAEIQRKMEGALQFQLKLEYRSVLTGNQITVLTSEFKVAYRPDKTSWGMLVGSGEGQITDYTHTEAPDWTVSAPPFPVSALIKDFDPCAGTATLAIDRFYTDPETYALGEDQSQTLPLTQTTWTTQYANKLGNEGIYQFTMTVLNLQETAVEQTFEGDQGPSGGNVVGKFEVKLVHTPKRY